MATPKHFAPVLDGYRTERGVHEVWAYTLTRENHYPEVTLRVFCLLRERLSDLVAGCVGNAVGYGKPAYAEHMLRYWCAVRDAGCGPTVYTTVIGGRSDGCISLSWGEVSTSYMGTVYGSAYVSFGDPCRSEEIPAKHATIVAIGKLVPCPDRDPSLWWRLHDPATVVKALDDAGVVRVVRLPQECEFWMGGDRFGHGWRRDPGTRMPLLTDVDTYGKRTECANGAA